MVDIRFVFPIGNIDAASGQVKNNIPDREWKGIVNNKNM